MELVLDIAAEELLGRELPNDELRRLATKLFRGVDAAKLVSEGGGRGRSSALTPT